MEHKRELATNRERKARGIDERCRSFVHIINFAICNDEQNLVVLLLGSKIIFSNCRCAIDNLEIDNHVSVRKKGQGGEIH